jgi:hypothetical protein
MYMKGGFQPKSPKKGTHKRRKSNSSSKMTSSKSPVSYMGGKRRSSRKRRSGKKWLGGVVGETCYPNRSGSCGINEFCKEVNDGTYKCIPANFNGPGGGLG